MFAVILRLFLLLPLHSLLPPPPPLVSQLLLWMANKRIGERWGVRRGARGGLRGTARGTYTPAPTSDKLMSQQGACMTFFSYSRLICRVLMDGVGEGGGERAVKGVWLRAWWWRRFGTFTESPLLSDPLPTLSSSSYFEIVTFFSTLHIHTTFIYIFFHLTFLLFIYFLLCSFSSVFSSVSFLIHLIFS